MATGLALHVGANLLKENLIENVHGILEQVVEEMNPLYPEHVVHKVILPSDPLYKQVSNGEKPLRKFSVTYEYVMEIDDVWLLDTYTKMYGSGEIQEVDLKEIHSAMVYVMKEIFGRSYRDYMRRTTFKAKDEKWESHKGKTFRAYRYYLPKEAFFDKYMDRHDLVWE